jgi:hypothetical protein
MRWSESCNHPNPHQRHRHQSQFRIAVRAKERVSELSKIPRDDLRRHRSAPRQRAPKKSQAGAKGLGVYGASANEEKCIDTWLL